MSDFSDRINDISWELSTTWPDWKLQEVGGKLPKRRKLESTRDLAQMLKKENAKILLDRPTAVYAEIRGYEFVFLITSEGVKAFRPTPFYIQGE